MQGYESVLILDPNISEEEQKSLLEKIAEAIKEKGGSIVRDAGWGRRKLAYPVKKLEYGIYHLLYLDKSPDAVKALDNLYKFSEGILKWQTVSVEDVEAEYTKFEKLKTEGSAAQTLSDR